MDHCGVAGSSSLFSVPLLLLSSFLKGTSVMGPQDILNSFLKQHNWNLGKTWQNFIRVYCLCLLSAAHPFSYHPNVQRNKPVLSRSPRLGGKELWKLSASSLGYCKKTNLTARVEVKPLSLAQFALKWNSNDLWKSCVVSTFHWAKLLNLHLWNAILSSFKFVK